MRILSQSTLAKFWEDFPDAENQLRAWYAEAKRAAWKTPADIKAMYGTASVLKGRRVVFNIHGNKYRLVVRFDYEHQIGFVRFIGTHADYDKINAEEV